MSFWDFSGMRGSLGVFRFYYWVVGMVSCFRRFVGRLVSGNVSDLLGEVHALKEPTHTQPQGHLPQVVEVSQL